MSRSLPTEILVEIFSNCDYITLKCSVIPACRLFRSIIESASAQGKISEALFIDKLNPNRKKMPNFKLHPCIRFLQIRNGLVAGCDPDYITPADIPIRRENMGFKSRNGEFLPINDTPMAEENAFSPSWHKLELFINIGDEKVNRCYEGWFHNPPELYDGKGITVSQLLNAIDSVMAKDFHDQFKYLFEKGPPVFYKFDIAGVHTGLFEKSVRLQFSFDAIPYLSSESEDDRSEDEYPFYE